MYKSKTYHPDNVVDAFVRYSQLDDKFYFCERGTYKRYDIRQGEIEYCFLPLEVQNEARRLAGVWPSYVEVDKQITIKWGKVD